MAQVAEDAVYIETVDISTVSVIYYIFNTCGLMIMVGTVSVGHPGSDGSCRPHHNLHPVLDEPSKKRSSEAPIMLRYKSKGWGLNSPVPSRSTGLS